MENLQQRVTTERQRLAEQRNVLLRQFYMELGRLNGLILAYDTVLTVLALSGVTAPPAPPDATIQVAHPPHTPDFEIAEVPPIELSHPPQNGNVP